ncbi:MAG: sigma-54 dependent transcriptional regulator [Pseudomonadota bacterium]
MKRLLVIDDESGHRLMVRAVMEDAGWHVSEASSGEEGLSFLQGERVHVVLLDMRMSGMSGQETLPRILDICPSQPVIMLTAYGTVGSAVEAMKSGAFDYLTKPADNEELIAVLEKAWKHNRLVEENEELRRRLGDDDPTAALIGSGPAMRKVRDFIRQAGASEATVLIMGESGTGKELIAQALHDSSPRAKAPLVKVNCAALPGHLLESELFGYVRGAFTGAVKDKPGRFQLARGGTLFLDEIGELPLELQSKLLRALQERVVEPLGGVRPVPVDVRIVAATNRDLRKEVALGNFREDLYFRLNVLELVSPPLRNRLEDLSQLVAFLFEKLCRKNRKSVRNVTPDFFEALASYDWPGNVRELENVLERALILSRSDTLTADVLPPQIFPQDVWEGEHVQAAPLDASAFGSSTMHRGERTGATSNLTGNAAEYGSPLRSPQSFVPNEYSTQAHAGGTSLPHRFGQGRVEQDVAKNNAAVPHYSDSRYDAHVENVASSMPYAATPQGSSTGEVSFVDDAIGHGSLDDAERETLMRALDIHGGHREKTADALGISRRTLQYKLKKFGLTRRT